MPSPGWCSLVESIKGFFLLYLRLDFAGIVTFDVLNFLLGYSFQMVVYFHICSCSFSPIYV